VWAWYIGGCHALLLAVSLIFAGSIGFHNEVLLNLIALGVTTAALVHLLRERRHRGCHNRCCVEYNKRLKKLIVSGLPLFGVALIVSIDSFGHGILIYNAYPDLSRFSAVVLSILSGVFVGGFVLVGLSAGGRGLEIAQSYTSFLGRPVLLLLGACWIWLFLSMLRGLY